MSNKNKDIRGEHKTMIQENVLVQVYWSYEGEWYRGTVAFIDKCTGKRFIICDDDDYEYLYMGNEVWRHVGVKGNDQDLPLALSQLVNKVHREKLKVKVKGFQKWRREAPSKRTRLDSVSVPNKEWKPSLYEELKECQTTAREPRSIVSEVGRRKRQESTLEKGEGKNATILHNRMSMNEMKLCFQFDKTSNGECAGIQNLVWRPCRLHPTQKQRKRMQRVSFN